MATCIAHLGGACVQPVLLGLLLVLTLVGYCTADLPDTCQVIVPVAVEPTSSDSQPGSPGSSPSLVDYLQLLSGFNTPSTRCFNITLLPGRHSFVAPMAVKLPDVVVVLSGSSSGEVQVEFDLAMADSSVLQFESVRYLEVTGISFMSSSGFLSFVDVDTLVVSSCVFSNFSQGAISVRNARQLDISDSVFEGNGGSEASRQKGFQGGSGGLSVNYESTTNATLTITNCIFMENIAESDQDIKLSPSEFTRGSDFTGRGGALSLIFYSNDPVTAVIRDCQFINNIAEGYGGAVYVVFNSASTHSVMFLSSRFRNNQAQISGGAISVVHVASNTENGSSSRFEVMDGMFGNNTAPYGGAVYFIATTNQSAQGRIGIFAGFSSSSFVGNNAGSFGAAIGITSLNLFSEKFQNRPVEVENCVFIRNIGRGGTLSVSYYPLLLSGNNTLRQNTGPALLIVGATVRVMGDTEFRSNNAEGMDGGALYVVSYGQLLFAQQGLRLIFNGNRGDLGASLVLEVPKTPVVYSTTLYNPLCPIIHDQNRTSPVTWNRVNMAFIDNTAQVGAAIYTNRLTLCSWTNISAPFFDIRRAFRWRFITFGGNKNRLKMQDNTDEQIQTQAVTIVVNGTIDAYPGEKVEVNVVSFGELGQPTYAVWRFKQTSSSVRFDPQVVSSSNFDSPVSLRIYSNRSVNEADTFRLEEPTITASVETLLTEDSNLVDIDIDLRDCPPGYRLQSWSIRTYDDCACNTDREEIAYCDGRQISMIGVYWAKKDRSLTQDQLFITTCPPGYCRCIVSRDAGLDACLYVHNNRQEDFICSCDREGVLCGVCRNSSFGVSALLNHCTTCDDSHATLITTLIIVDAVVFTILLLVMIPFPDCLLPSVFYIQLLPFITEYFPVTFDKIQPYLYYTGSAMSFYFAYDFCLYSNMSALVSYTLRFIPLATVLIVCPTVLLIRLLCVRRGMANPQSQHPMSRPVYWHGVTWILILGSTHNLHSAMSVLRCPSIPTDDGNAEFRWFYDGSVQCFTGAHMGLSMMALLVLVVGVALIPTTIILASDIIKRVRWPHYLSEPLTYCYRKELWWWSGVEQARRIAFLVFIFALPQNTFPILFLTMLSVGLYGMLMPYKTKLANAMEVVISSVVVVLLLIPNTRQIVEWMSDIPMKSPPPPSSMDMCQDDIEGVTDLALFLGLMYYIPLLLTVGVVIGLGCRFIYSQVKLQLHSRDNKSSIGRKFSRTFSFKPRGRAVTKTEVAISNSDDSAEMIEMVRLAEHRKASPKQEDSSCEKLRRQSKASLKREDSGYEKLHRQSTDKYVGKPLVEETSFNVTTSTVVEIDQNDTSSMSSSGSSRVVSSV